MTLHVSISPNPFDLLLDIEVLAGSSMTTILRLLDHNKNIVRMMSWSLKKGTNKTTFEDLASLPAGYYIVDISTMKGKNLYNTRLLKIN